MFFGIKYVHTYKSGIGNWITCTHIHAPVGWVYLGTYEIETQRNS